MHIIILRIKDYVGRVLIYLAFTDKLEVCFNSNQTVIKIPYSLIQFI